MKGEFGAEFTFTSWQFGVSNGELKLEYSDSEYGDFVEVFQFSDLDTQRYQELKEQIDKAIDCLHWMVGVSYYKTSLAQHIKFDNQVVEQSLKTGPNQLQASWLADTWQHGLAELAYENNLPWLKHINFNAVSNQEEFGSIDCHLSARSLVAIGGGKDSLVSVEAIKAMGEKAHLFMVGQSEFIQSVAEVTGLPLLQIKRTVDPRLKQANAAGAFNGHVPITAINTCVAVVAALLYDFDSVVFSNERSADSGNVQLDDGQWVNHQYSKSLVYEKNWQQIVHQEIASDLDCFSLLRPFSELAIVRKFSVLNNYFAYFSSCNRNFHLAGSQNHNHHWCGVCPKCAFVFLCLAPYINKVQLVSIFKKDLLVDTSLKPLFESLLGLQGNKPFECVGEQQECRLALQLLSQHKDWQNQQQIRQWIKVLPDISVQEANEIMGASDAHIIPSKRNFGQVMINAT